MDTEGKKTILLVVAIGVAIAASTLMKQDWRGFYYPNESDLSSHIESGEFRSLAMCRNWVDDQVGTYNPNGHGYDYECGKSCRTIRGSDLLKCKKTVR